MKRIAALVLLGCIAACSPAMESQVSENGAVASLIAVVDGCRIWRINDGSNVYFARCPEGAADVSWRRSAGKTTVRVQTVGDIQSTGAER